MRNKIRKLLYVLACAIPVYISAAGLGTPVSGTTYIQFSEMKAFMTLLWAECSADPLTCVDNADFQLYGVDQIAAGVESATRADCKTNTVNCNITVADVIGNVGFGETEPNDFINAADVLTRQLVDTKYEYGPVFGQTYSTSDIDWYTINTLENNTAMNVWFAMPADGASSWKVSVLDTSGNILAQFNTLASAETNFKVQARNVGKQYVTVESSTTGSTVLYEMAVILTGAQGGEADTSFSFAGETEPNNYLQSADLLTQSQTIVGQSYSAQDADWYLVETYENNTLLEFWFGNSVSTWNVEFTDSSGNVLAAFDTTANQVFSYQMQAGNLGKYYLRIKANGVTSDPYQISVVYKNEAGGTTQPDFNAFDVERENNDLFSRADTLGNLASTVDVRGQLAHKFDVDLFRIDSPGGNETVTIELCPEGSICSLDEIPHWAVYLFDGRKVSDSMLNTLEVGGPDWGLFYDESAAYQWVADDDPGIPDNETTWVKEDVPKYLTYPSDHLYFLKRFNVFGDGLIGIIDTLNGEDTKLNFSIQQPGTYYIGISSLLEESGTYANWEVVTRQEVIEFDEDIIVITHQNFTTDEYTFRITRTTLSPNFDSIDTSLGKDVINAPGNSGSGSTVKDVLSSLSSFL